MDFGMLPPEINSGRMYTGPGSGSMRAAAAASGELATELQSTVSSYTSVISTLTSGLVAQISEKPESVQDHTVDQEGLDSLLEQLSKKPGIHEVRLSNGDKPKVVPSDAQLG